MLCDECAKRPASVHITKVENGKKTEVHLCETCAMEKNIINVSHSASFSINDLLAGLINHGTVMPMKMGVVNDIKCDVCGMTYNQFKETGRFGCSRCYETFGDKLNPVFKRVHGNTAHTGKVPNKAGGRIKTVREIERLRQELDLAIGNEEYEKAAALRDRIRALTCNAEREGDGKNE